MTAAQVEHLCAALRDPDPGAFFEAVGDVLRDRGGVGRAADRVGVTREHLHRALSATGNLSFRTIFGLVRNMGLELAVRRKE